MWCNRRTLGTSPHVFWLLLFLTIGYSTVTYGELRQDNQETSVAFKATRVTSHFSDDASGGFQCLREGSFPVPGSCTNFYQCVDVPGHGFLDVLFACPTGTIYDDSLDTCSLAPSVTTRPECTGEEVDTGNAYFEVGSDSKIKAISTESSTNGTLKVPPGLKRRKQDPIPTVSTGLITLGSLIIAATGISSGDDIANYKSIGGGSYSRSVENKLSGIHGKIMDLNLTAVEMETENKIKFEMMQNLVSKGRKDNRYDFEISQSLINGRILENHIRLAIIQGLINQGKGDNEVNFVKIQVSIGDVKEFVDHEISKAKSDIQKGYNSFSNSVEKSVIEPFVCELLTLVREFNERVNNVESLPEKDQINKIEKSGGYSEYLESSVLQDTLYAIIHQNLAIPSNDTDTTAVIILDMLVYGLQIHASMLSSGVSTNVYLAGKALEERNLEEFNTYMLRVSASVNRVKLALGYRGSHGLMEEVKEVIRKVQKLPYASEIQGLNELLLEKQTDLNQLESDINEFIDENTELNQPGLILGIPDITTSSISIPIGPWESGKQVSYAIQYVSERRISRIGDWSRLYTVRDRGHPVIRLTMAAENITRLVYRRFNQEKPELVAILSNNEHTSFRDINRDLITAASRPNEDEAITEVRALLDERADVNVALENKMTPLHYAAKYGNVEVMRLISNETVNINAKSSDDEEALHFAALGGNEEAVRHLINREVSINAQTKFLGWSPLHISVANNHVGVTRLLVKNGGSVNIRDNKGLTPLHLSIIGNGDTLEVLMGEESLDVNAKAADGQTPLHYAARSSSAFFVITLLQSNKIEINSLSDNHLSPLHFAVMSGNVEILTELIRQGASVSLADKYGSTPLHYAAFYGNADTTLALIEKDESLKNVKNTEEKTAFDLATENNNTEIVMILTNETEYLMNKMKAEIEHSTDPDQEALSKYLLEEVNCTQEEVQEIAIHSEKTCMHIGHITKYVHIIVSMLPVNVQYEDMVDYAQLIRNYNRDLIVAKTNANLWRNEDSILGRIQQAFKLAKNFEPAFNRKYKIKQERVTMILQNQDKEKGLAKAEAEIHKLEEDLQAVRNAVEKVIVRNVKLFMENRIRILENELKIKRELIAVDPATTLELQELIDFLEFVRNDASAIKQTALTIKLRTLGFKDNLEKDRKSIEKNRQYAKDSLANLQLQSIGNNKDLVNIQKTQERLSREVEEEKQRASCLYDQMYKTHEALRDKRRYLLWKMGIVTKLKYVGALLSGVIIGKPLLFIADIYDRQLIKDWNDNLALGKNETARLTAEIESKQQKITQSREIIANSSSNSEILSKELTVFNRLDRDLQSITEEVPSLQPSISKAISGLEKIEEVFNIITDKFDEMIGTGKAANTATEKQGALNLIHAQLSQLQCYWKDSNIYIMDVKECSRKYSLMQIEELVLESSHS